MASIPPPSQDPFYLIRADITSQYSEIQQKLHRFHMLTATNPDRKALGREVEAECDSIKDQVDMLTDAVNTAAENPARFNLTMDEIGARRKWLETTGRQVNGIKDSIRTMTSSKPQVPTVADRITEANDTYLRSEQQVQQQLIRQQDDHLGDLEHGLDNVTGMASQIKDHLAEDERLLTDLEGGMDTTMSRLKATSKKMADLIRKSGSTSQLIIIIVLIIVVVILAYFVFKI